MYSENLNIVVRIESFLGGPLLTIVSSYFVE